MDEEHIVYRFSRNPEEEFRFTLREYKERGYLDIRLWFQPAQGGDMRPTKKGVTFSVEVLNEVKKGLDRAEKAAGEMALQSASRPVK